MDFDWMIEETSFDPAQARAWEGLFTQGSGELHVRGSLEEHLSGAPQDLDYTRRPANVTSEKFVESKARWGVFIPRVRGVHPLLNRGLANLPWILDLTPSVDGEKLDVETCAVEHYRRRLNLRDGLLARELTWRTRSGAKVEILFERFVSAARPRLCLQRLSIRSDRPCALHVRAGLDTGVRTSGVDIFDEVDAGWNVRAAHCSIVTNNGDRVKIETRLDAPGCSRAGYKTKRAAYLTAERLLLPGEWVLIEKRTAVCADGERPGDLLDAAAEAAWAGLVAEHAAIWQDRWEACDVEVAGDEEAQRALRVSLYHLLRAHPRDERVAIDPKGVAGDAYRGCYFWDTEMYMLPFFLYTDPEAGRQLAAYRIHSLRGAEQNAAASGYAGARYAWEADVDGSETCPNWQYRDHEIHVTADVAYGLAHTAEALGEPAWLREQAGAVLAQTARYWLDRLDWRATEETPSLLGVMGPDEYTPISSNNAFTNRMAAFNLSLAARSGKDIGLSSREIHQCQVAADSLPVLRRDGLVLQCEEYERLAEPAFERFWKDRSRTFAAQAPQEWLYRSKCLKQADVLLLMMLFPSEFSDEEVRRAWDTYLPYTTHDSSLSAGVHAVVACRLGKMEEALQFWRQSAGLDLNLAGGGPSEGIHMAAAGMNWQGVVFGFAGLRSMMQSNRLSLNPRLPSAWTRLAFPLIWRGQPVRIEMIQGETHVANRSQSPLEVEVAGVARVLEPGETGIFSGA